MTLASCVSEIKLDDVSIRAGSKKHNVGGVIGHVEKVIIHPKYGELTRDYDIAVLKLIGCLAINRSKIKAITVSQEHVKIKEGLVSGWVSNESAELKFYKVIILPPTECNNTSGQNITKHMLCTKKTKEEQCIDISIGSPLVAEGKLIGIISFGHRCDLLIYSNISALSNFINGIIERYIEL